MKTILFKRCIWKNAIAALLMSSLAHSQITEMQFERISIESGLSQSSILAICQDYKGFLWFGTYEGLNRYDGYQFKVYKNDPENPHSLSKSSIEFIFEDHFGVLWVGTEDGLNQFDREKEQFTRYKNDPDDPNSLSNNFVRYVYEDRAGILWVGTQGGGLNQFDRNTGKFINYVNDPDNPKSLSQNSVLSILEDRYGRLWVGTDDGLNYFDRQKGEFTRYAHDKNNPNTISHNSVWRIYEDRAGNLWMGTWGGGLNLFDFENNRFIRYQNNPNDPASIGGTVVRSIFEDSRGNLWVGTTNGGVLNRVIADSNGGSNRRFIRYQHNAYNPTSLSSDAITALFEDRLGFLWIGTNYNGVNKYNPRQNQFALFRNHQNDINSLSKNTVLAVYEDHEGIVWIGTDGGGLNRLDKKKNQFTRYLFNLRDPRSLSNNSVRSIYEDRYNRLWIGTENGLNYFDRKKGEFTSYKHDPKNPRSVSNNNIWCIAEDRAGNLWMGTWGGGLNKFNFERKEFARYVLNPENPEYVDESFVWTIHRDSAGMFWVGTLNDGLSRFNPDDGTSIHYHVDNQNPNSISDNKVLSLFEDQAGNFWVGTSNGLNKFNRKSGTFRHYTVRDGLPNNSLQGILQDDHGNLWMSTNNGLTKFNPVTEKFKNYFESYGLQSNEFSVNACFKTRSGEMIFGGINGLNIFHPDSIRDDVTLPPVMITDFQIFNGPVPIGKEVDGSVVLDKSISVSRKINLSYSQNVFSFEFAALHFASPKDNRYAYMMEGFDKQWNFTNANRRFVTYTNLPAGDYLFRVKASNNQGIWNEKGASIHITIAPPYWQTLWFKLMIALVLIGMAFLTYKRWMRARELAEKMRIDEALAKERNLLRTLIDNLPDYVYVKNTEGIYMVGNSAIVSRLGLKAEPELLGKTDFHLFPKESAEEYIAHEQKMLLSGKDISIYEGPMVDSDKHEQDRWVITTIVPFRDTQGTIIGTIGIGRDITERKRVEEEREILITELQNALADVKVLSGLVPICSNCKKIRDDSGFWNQLESYIQKHSQAKFSHGICPDCMAELYPDVQLKTDKGKE